MSELIEIIESIESKENKNIAVLVSILNLLEHLDVTSRLGCLELAKVFTLQEIDASEEVPPTYIW